jgi:hypothetical protein
MEYAYQYGCDEVALNTERFECKRPCGYLMEDRKCGKLVRSEVKEGVAPVSTGINELARAKSPKTRQRKGSGV